MIRQRRRLNGHNHKARLNQFAAFGLNCCSRLLRRLIVPFSDAVGDVTQAAHAINAQGQTVGSEWLDDSEAYAGSPAGFYGYLRQVDGFVQYFAITESFPGRTRARGISENGLVTGYLVDPATGEAKGFVTVLSPDVEFQDISVAAENVLFQSPCNPEGSVPADESVLVATDVFTSQIRNDGVVVGSCQDVYQNIETGEFMVYGYGFIATPAE